MLPFVSSGDLIFKKDIGLRVVYQFDEWDQDLVYLELLCFAVAVRRADYQTVVCQFLVQRYSAVRSTQTHMKR